MVIGSKQIGSILVGMLMSLLTLAADSDPRIVRIGYQKYSPLYLLKLNGALDRRLVKEGQKIEWSEFAYGVPMLEALNAGQLDFATTGETPPVLALSRRGSDLVYVGQEPPAPRSEAVIVAGNSEIKTISQLRGKRVAVAKGANAHYFLLRLLESAGLSSGDIQWVFLPPADAVVAFRTHAVDAWAIWDFQRALAEQQLGARTLLDGQGVVQNFECYTSRSSFVKNHEEIIRVILDELSLIDSWINAHPELASLQLSKELGIDPGILRVAYERRQFGAATVTKALLENQRQVAETLFINHLIPSEVDSIRAFPSLK